MADSIRKRITDAVLVMLDGNPAPGAPALASGRINKSHRIPVGRHEIPMYCVYFLHEAPTPAGNPRRPVILDRKLLIETRIIVHGTDDDADQHCQWVISRLGTGQPVTASDGTALTMAISEAETIFEPLEGSEGVVTVTSIRWTVEYRTNPADITRLS
jgi:hypothetical protein